MIKLVVFDIDGVITNGKLLIDSSGTEYKQVDFKDIDAFFEIKRKGFKTAIITGEKTKIVDWFKNKFTPDYFYSGVNNKLSILQEIEEKSKIEKKDICFIGDSKHDLESIMYSGLGVCPNDALEIVKENADLVLKNNGGANLFYELIDILEEKSENNTFIMNFEDTFVNSLIEHNSLVDQVINDPILKESVFKSCKLIINAFNSGRKLLICGNGGSAADSQHLATEFVSRFFLERKALNAEALTVNTSSLTAISNDYDFSRIFARQIEAKGNKGDILLGISTSGKSESVLEALISAKKLSMKTIALVGRDSNKTLQSYSDIIISVPSCKTPRIQELHITLGHIICEIVESTLF